MPFLAVVYARTPQQARGIRLRYNPDSEAGRVVGIYWWPPSSDLTCKGYCGNRNQMSPWRRNRNGFMECGTCGKRHRETKKRFVGALFDYLGRNLLRRDHTPRAFRNPEGWDRQPTESHSHSA